MSKGMKNVTQRTFSIRVPGKLMIAGEYAVLEANCKGIVVAVDRYITAYISYSQENRLSLPQLGLEDITWNIKDGKVKFSVEDPRLTFIQNSISVVSQYLKEKYIELKAFNLRIDSQLNNVESGKKYGLGSSAAIVVAVISSILTIQGLAYERYKLDEIFKLSVIAHLKTQGSGSGADIAAAVYGGWLQYSSYSAQWVLDKLEQGIKISDLIDKPWPNLFIANITPPTLLEIAVGWTQEIASTKSMIESVYNFRKADPHSYNEFLRESQISVEALIESFKENNVEEAINNLRQNRKALLKLGEQAELEIETDKLKKLCSIAEDFGSGKQSGAGGGDCGIAFLKKDVQIEDLYRSWQSNDIIPLTLRISSSGLAIEIVSKD